MMDAGDDGPLEFDELSMSSGLYVPEGLEAYHAFHEPLNCFTWLIKARYADRAALKRRTFRLDHLWQAYLGEQVRDLARVRRGLTPKGSSGLAADRTTAALKALQKVWYNELAYATPQVTDPLLLDGKGVTRNKEASSKRHAFTSWRIAQAYYTVYFTLQTLLELRASDYDPVRHVTTHKVFKSSVFDAIRGSLVGFPFDIAGAPGLHRWSLAKLPADAHYLRYRYADHPRYQGWRREGTFEHTVRRFQQALADRAPAFGGQRVMLPDLLKAMRVWANYTDIESLVTLKNSGYRWYFDQDLHIVTFFFAGMAEVAALAMLGSERVLALARTFASTFVDENIEVAAGPAPHGLDVRLRLYQHLGWLEETEWVPLQPARSYTEPVPMNRVK